MCGEKRKTREGDFHGVYEDLLAIVELSDLKKRAKLNLIEATHKYEEACSELAKMRVVMNQIFDDLD